MGHLCLNRNLIFPLAIYSPHPHPHQKEEKERKMKEKKNIKPHDCVIMSHFIYSAQLDRMVEYFTDFKPTQPLRETCTLRGFKLMFGFGNKLPNDKRGRNVGI